MYEFPANSQKIWFNGTSMLDLLMRINGRMIEGLVQMTLMPVNH